MNKKFNTAISILTAGVLVATAILGITGSFAKTFIPSAPDGLTFEVNDPAYEKIITNSDSWVLTAGGKNDSTHYARIKYKLPEQAGLVLTEFYAKITFILPSDFYAQQRAGFRLLNTDNISAKLSTNGLTVGALDANELRYGVYLWNSDKRLHLRCEHETKSSLELWRSPTSLPVGEHTIELYGDISKVAPYYLRIDGKIVASGVSALCPLDTAPSERVITRMVGGIDGAADQDTTPLTLSVSLFEIRDYDPYATNIQTPTAAPIIITPTMTQIVPSPTITRTPVVPTLTKTPSASVTPTPTPDYQNVIKVNGTMIQCPCVITVP